MKLGRRRGVALIMVAGVLAVLAALATGFYVLATMQVKSASRYADSVRAEMMANAGVHYAIAQLRQQAFRKTEDPTDAWYMVDYLHGARKTISYRDSPLLHNGIDDDGDKVADNPEEALVNPLIAESYTTALGSTAGEKSDRFALNVSDAAGKININACDNLAVVLDNLCRVVGPPLVAANLDALQPQRWAVEMDAADPARPLYATSLNKDDTAINRDIYYRLSGDVIPARIAGTGRPMADSAGAAIYGDGYAIAGYRGRKGPFRTLEEVKNALTYVERSSPPNDVADDPLERLEIEVKFAAIRDYITVSSWVDVNTVCVGKFEWVHFDTADHRTYAIDRDKSWVIDDLVGDPLNTRGSLRGCYVSIVNGHGAGQLRRVRTNGIDWIEVEGGFSVTPGAISSYMIIAGEDALLADAAGRNLNYAYPDKPPPLCVLAFPQTKPDGTLVDNPKIDYARYPLCIHRAPVNINTASDKVLAALLMGLDVQHGHPMALGTDVDGGKLRTKWKKTDPHGVQPYLLTPAGLKRAPADSGKLAYNAKAPVPPASSKYDFAYLNNYGLMNRADYGPDDPLNEVNPVQELVYRILIARQYDPDLPYMNAPTGDPQAKGGLDSYKRGPFRTWDDFYFRVVKPFDDAYFKAGWTDTNGDNVMDPGDICRHGHLARLIMANFNSNTNILKFNPNIEWIDRWGRNFTEQEAVMIYTDAPEPHSGNVAVADPLSAGSIPVYTVADGALKSSQRDAAGNFIMGAYITRNYRYKSDELIDKTDLNRSTTEFSFDSNGVFEITSVGQVVGRDTVLAERKFTALVKIYDVWRESTQAQFVQGKLSKAFGPRGGSCSGQLARDASNVSDRLALVTLPEPLVPLKARIVDDKGKPNPRNAEVVSLNGQPLDAYGNVRKNPYDPAAAAIDVPDVIANHIQPARYDGQIVLATNTSAYDPSSDGDADTFLATYDGDLDTATCAGNGREQAKTPRDCKVRVVDTLGLLGALNDTNRDMDPGLPLVGGQQRWVYNFVGLNAALQALQEGPDPDRPYYWNNVTLRMGDLRTDGVYLTGPGVAGNDATLKYLFGPNKENFQPDSKEGNCITMWAKPVWPHDDYRHHEFFNASNDGSWNVARGCYIHKYGQYTWCLADDNIGIGHSGNRTKINDLFCFWERDNAAGNCDDYDYGSMIHGGYAYVNAKTCPDESPGYRVQPFRWHFLGCRQNYRSVMIDGEGDGPRGHWVPVAGDYQNPKNMTLTRYHLRPFIDTQLHPEGESTWKPNLFWSFRTTPVGGLTHCEIGDPGSPNASGAMGQDVKWEWADPVGQVNGLKCFGMNNLNYGNIPWQNATTDPHQVIWHYRHMPDDGTYAVIDELKISSKDRVLRDDNPDWPKDRVVREICVSRYYLPPKPGSRAKPTEGGPPTFSSQTLLQSLKGFDKKKGGEQVAVVRVSWNVFTPRFMSEYKQADGRFKRNERLTYDRTTQQTVPTPFKGPFDYVKYNDETDTSAYGVNRPPPTRYRAGLVYASRGVEVELLRDADGVNESGDEKVLQRFVDPSDLNVLGTLEKPVNVFSHELRYRVRFRYPVDPLVNPGGGIADVDGQPCVDPEKQYLLDTPVFDDISITYITPPRIRAFREVSE
ncbi:MAG: hypothetical protein NTW87_18825 [Planctomycetota bacterium]|nr:hypothetical protein [Planctomycetota bacterium]